MQMWVDLMQTLKDIKKEYKRFPSVRPTFFIFLSIALVIAFGVAVLLIATFPYGVLVISFLSAFVYGIHKFMMM